MGLPTLQRQFNPILLPLCFRVAALNPTLNLVELCGLGGSSDVQAAQQSNPNARGFEWSKLAPARPLPTFNCPARVVAHGVRDEPPPRMVDAWLAHNEAFQVCTEERPGTPEGALESNVRFGTARENGP
jgi:hypothetical protein